MRGHDDERMMSVRTTFRTSTTYEIPTDAGKFRQKQFNSLALATAWIELHIPTSSGGLLRCGWTASP